MRSPRDKSGTKLNASEIQAKGKRLKSSYSQPNYEKKKQTKDIIKATRKNANRRRNKASDEPEAIKRRASGRRIASL